MVTTPPSSSRDTVHCVTTRAPIRVVLAEDHTIVREGLREGEQVIVNGLLRVRPGLDWIEGRPAPRNTLVEMQVARPGETRYTTLFSMADQALRIGR